MFFYPTLMKNTECLLNKILWSVHSLSECIEPELHYKMIYFLGFKLLKKILLDKKADNIIHSSTNNSS